MAQPQIIPQVEAGLKRLDDLARRTPEMVEAVAFYRAAIPLLWQARADVPAFTLDPALALRKLEAGRPLLVDEALPLDGEATTALFLRLCQLVEEMEADAGNGRAGWSFFKRSRPQQAPAGSQRADRPATAAAARQIREAVSQNRLELAAVWAALALGQRAWLAQTAVQLGLEPDLLWVLAQNSLKPALRVWAQLTSQAVPLERWRRGSCPLCGNAPVLSEIQGKEGERRLRCGLCGAGWHYPRLQCVFCNGRDHRTLGIISIAGEEEKYRVQTCDACRRYIKVVVTYDPIPVELLIVEELATLHLDQAAGELDFARP